MSDGRVPGWTPSEGAPLPPPPVDAAASGSPPFYCGVPPPDSGAAHLAHTGPAGTNGLAVGALVCGLVGVIGGLLTCGLLAPVTLVGLVLGHVALAQIKRTGQEGRGMALTGVVIGWIPVALVLLWLLTVVLISIASTM